MLRFLDLFFAHNKTSQPSGKRKEKREDNGTDSIRVGSAFLVRRNRVCEEQRSDVMET